MPFPERYDPKEAEPRIQRMWADKKLFAFDPQTTQKVYSIDTPPPTVSGKMHMGHAFSYSHSDFIARFQRMKGMHVFYPFGLDDNGLATERYVEARSGKRAVDMTRSEFTALCLAETKEAEAQMIRDWQRLGSSCDWNWLYRTIDDDARAISQRSFIELFKEGRAYRKKAPSIWCPECRTAIAQVELEDKESGSFFNDITFQTQKGPLTIATTRPEMLAACVAVIVHPDDTRYASLVGTEATVPLFEHKVPIIADKRADPEKGSGAVMCCTFGDQTDMEWWKAYNLPLRIIINIDGTMNVPGYEGLYVNQARKKIIEQLQQKGILSAQKPIKHIVNVHERCGRPMEILVQEQWYIKYLDLREEFLRLGGELNWRPSHMKNRYDNWVKGLQWDWSISRQRFFGVPFPCWYCSACGETVVADIKDLPVDPLTTKPKTKCRCGHAEFVPEKDVMDTWATSSLTPQIALRWNKNPELFEKLFPMSLRPQAHDIISFWLFNTVVKGYFHHRRLPWANVMISGWALDPQGKKMSKSKGNVIEPQEMIGKYSSDALRFWAASTKLGEDLAFSEREFIAGTRTITKMWNSARFCSTHLETYDKREKMEKGVLDRWIESKLSRLVADCTRSFEEYEYVRVRLDAEKFFWQTLCDNYLEFVKDRLYNSDAYDSALVNGARATLYETLLAVTKLFAPIMPHVTEEIYTYLFHGKEKDVSVHISSWPTPGNIDEEAEQIGDVIAEIVSLSRKIRSQRQQSQKAEFETATITVEKPLEEKLKACEQDLKALLHARKIEFGAAEDAKGNVANLSLK